MHYSLGILNIGENTELSTGDIAFIKTIYPFKKESSSDIDLLLNIFTEKGEKYISIIRDLRPDTKGTIYIFKHPLQKVTRVESYSQYSIGKKEGSPMYEFKPEYLSNGYTNTGIKILPISKNEKGVLIVKDRSEILFTEANSRHF